MVISMFQILKENKINLYFYTLMHACMLSCFSCFQISADPMNCSLAGSSVHGILWARLLEWVVMPFSGGIFLTQGLNLQLLQSRQILNH